MGRCTVSCVVWLCVLFCAQLDLRDCDVSDLRMNVLASDMPSFCCGGLCSTEGDLLDFPLPCSKNYVWVRKLKFASSFGGVGLRTLCFSKCCYSESLLSSHHTLRTFRALICFNLWINANIVGNLRLDIGNTCREIPMLS